MHASKQWHYETLARATVEALKRNNFDALYAEDAAAACRAILALIPTGTTLGFGSSVSLEEVGVVERLRSGDYECINPPWVEAGMTPGQRLPLRRRAMAADVFLTGTNALTVDGKLVNTDATGNRVAGMIFGPKKTMVVGQDLGL